MISAGRGIFVEFPQGRTERVLHPAKVVVSGHGGFAAEFLETDLAYAPGQRVEVFADVRGEFIQQSAHIDLVMPGEGAALVGFRLCGEPATAEQRTLRRYSVGAVPVQATFAGEQQCTVLDVSEAGLSIRANKSVSTGSRQPLTLVLDGRTWSGHVDVVGQRKLSGGLHRYGLRPVLQVESAPLIEGMANLVERVRSLQILRLMHGG